MIARSGSMETARRPAIGGCWDAVRPGFCSSCDGMVSIQSRFGGSPNAALRWWAPALAILSGITYAGVILSMRGLPGEDKAWLIALNHIVVALIGTSFCVVGGAAIPTGSLLVGVGRRGDPANGVTLFSVCAWIKNNLVISRPLSRCWNPSFARLGSFGSEPGPDLPATGMVDVGGSGNDSGRARQSLCRVSSPQ